MDGRVVLLMTCLYIGGVVCTRRPSAVRIDNNGYKNILVAVHPDVPEDHSLVDAIQRMIMDASSFLHQATERRAYFSDVTILVPGHWTNDSWGRASAELYTNADVVVEKSDGNTSFDDVLPTSGAYTKAFGGCGVAGDRIVLFTDIFGPAAQDVYGELGRLFVHEWAHFRYGVFDEFAQRGEQQFYFSPASGRQEAVKCNRHLAGQVIRRISNESDVNCSSVNPQSGMYDDGCFFQPVTSDGVNANVTSSIMDTIKIPSVVHFCNDNTTDTNRIHNYEAPSRHNRLCGGKSSWSVISENQDFRHGKNPPRDVADTRPTFRVVRLGTGRQLLLAIDTSSSMKKGNKLTRSRQAISTFIGGLDPGVLLGVISFASSAEVLVPLTRITDDATRETMVKILPSSTQGQTNISSALSTALEVLTRNGSSASGTFLVLITDGKDTSLARLGHVMPAVRDAGVVTSLISFSSSQVPELELLAESTDIYLDHLAIYLDHLAIYLGL
ncbi:calcium-activated chloride channel regulator 1-like [Physella acuta]|uniref:calcium-activated chloride channel regulator 1-like n=1 Tax=Physella acuta TaxID=109671 RepID=UPI0027DBDAAD|nr:calcium-activated chloride channel regulator 1-like [Physella acuta]